MLDVLNALWPQIWGTAALAIGAWIAGRIKKPSDLERAQLLATIAGAAAALVVSKNPAARWPALLRDTINAVAKAAGLPTRNAAAIERAAADALIAAGVKPQ